MTVELVSILIPYKPRPEDSYRTRNLAAVTSHWCSFIDRFNHHSSLFDMAPQYEIVVGHNDDDAFNRSAALNDAFAKSKGDVVIVADADTIFRDGGAIEGAVQLAVVYGWAIPYGVYWNASESWTEEYMRRRGAPVPLIGAEGTYDHRLVGTISGMSVIRRSAWEKVRGFDARFKGWGYEDDAFGYAMWALVAPPKRLDEFEVIHLWHPHPPESNFGQPFINHNRALLWEYEQASKSDADAMQRLVDSR